MDRRSILVATLVVIMAAVATGAVALAQGGSPEASIPEDDAVATARAAVPGEVVEVELEDEEGVVAYEVEIATADGSVIEVLVDANSGEVIGQEVDDDVPGEPDDDDGPEDDD